MAMGFVGPWDPLAGDHLGGLQRRFGRAFGHWPLGGENVQSHIGGHREWRLVVGALALVMWSRPPRCGWVVGGTYRNVSMTR